MKAKSAGRQQVPAAAALAAGMLFALVPTGAPASEIDNPCGVKVILWETLGVAQPFGEWTARILYVKQDRASFLEATVRFGRQGLPADQARWFVAPATLEPAALFVTSESCKGKCLEDVCRELDRGGLAAVKQEATLRCIEAALPGEADNPRREVRPEVTDVLIRGENGGLLVNPQFGPLEDQPCGPDEPGAGSPPSRLVYTSEEHHITKETSLVSGETPELRHEALLVQRSTEILARLASRDSPTITGLPAIPTALLIFDELTGLDKRLPPELPDEFELTAAEGPRDYVEALAVRKLRWGGGRQEEYLSALKILGDAPAPRSTDFLVSKLHDYVAFHAIDDAALALRALLGADPTEARRQALPLLSNPDFVRPALGIFALTEPGLGEELQDLDVNDTSALRAGARRVLDYLATHAVEDDLKREAAEMKIP